MEEKAPETNVEKMTGEQLAGLLNQGYAQLLQAQQNISVINKELEKRNINKATPQK